MKRTFFVFAALFFAALALPPLWYALFPRAEPELPAPGFRVEVAPDLSVNVIERGAGPAVLMVHGHPGCGYDWTPLMDALVDRGRRVIAYDRVGYGRSDGRPPGPVTVDTNARELLQLIDVLELDDLTLVGWSYGGGASIVASRKDASRIGRLVLVGSIGPGIHERETVPKIPPFLVEFVAGPVFSWISRVPPIEDRVLGALGAAAFYPETAPAWFARQARANLSRPNTRDAMRSEGRDLDGTADLDPAGIELPILLIHGEQDRLAPLFVAERSHDLAPGSRLQVVENGGHMLPITHTELLADSIVEFADEVDR